MIYWLSCCPRTRAVFSNLGSFKISSFKLPKLAGEFWELKSTYLKVANVEEYWIRMTEFKCPPLPWKIAKKFWARFHLSAPSTPQGSCWVGGERYHEQESSGKYPSALHVEKVEHKINKYWIHDSHS